MTDAIFRTGGVMGLGWAERIPSVRTSAFDSLLGESPDGFVILKEVGKGAASTVYQAMQPDANNRLVALKVMNAAEQRLAQRGGDGRNPFERDVAISTLVPDPAIVRVFRAGRLADGRHYVAMEFVNGMNLADELSHRGVIPWPEAAEIGLLLAGALRALHQQHIVHRDLKPGNVMLRVGKDGRLYLKLIDLGLARLGPERDDGPAGVDSAGIGTPQYMAPEQARGEGTGFGTDVYALGAILYEMICGQPVVVASRPSPDAYLTYLRSDRPLPTMSIRALRPDVPSELARLVMSTLSRQRLDRAADAMAFEQLLAPLVQELVRDAERSSRTVVGRLRAAVTGLWRGRG